jgi:hypothetical protein
MVKKKKIVNLLIRIMIVFCLFEEIICSYIPSLEMIFFIPDLCILGALCLLIYSLKGKKIKALFTRSNTSCFILGFFLLYVCVSVAWSSFELYDIIKRFRYIFAGIATYWTVKKYLSNEDYVWIINFMSLAQFVNMLLTIYQNLVMDKHPDFCNGIFGFTGYANAAQGCFCTAISLLAFAYYLDGTWKAWRSFLLIGMSCVICAFAEIKIFFVLFVIGVVAIIVIRKNSSREKVKIIGAVAVIGMLLFVAYEILLIVLPNNLYAFFSVSGYLSYDGRSNYAGRTNAIPFIYEHLFRNNFFTSLIGTGMGSNSADYIYELGKSFAEFGFVGLAILGVFLLSIFLFYVRQRKKNRQTTEQLFCAVYAGIFLITLVVWNCTFTRFTFLNFFFLALSNVTWKRSRNFKGRKICRRTRFRL